MKLDRKTEILQTAARLFRQRGYQATSVKDIAHAIGIEAPSLYNHIGSKHETLKVLLLDVAEQFVSGIEEVHSSSFSGIIKLEKAIVHYVHLSYQRPDAISLITGEWVHLEESDRNRYLRLRDKYEDVFRKIYRQARREGNVKDVNEDIAIFSILSTLRWIYSWISKNKSFNKVELERQLVVSLLEGIRF